MANRENKPSSKRNSKLRPDREPAGRQPAQKSESANREAQDAGARHKTATIPERHSRLAPEPHATQADGAAAGGAERDGQADADLAAFPVVGIGASAGGLEAAKQFLEHLAPDTGMAYVLVQHLDPKHESLLSEILARSTNIPGPEK